MNQSQSDGEAVLTDDDLLLAALAVVGEADADLLTGLAVGLVPAVDSLRMGSLPGVEPCERGWRLNSAHQSALLNQLAEQTPHQFITLHERALALLSTRLNPADLTVEAQLVAVFDRLATFLVPYEPGQLYQVLAVVRTAPVTTPYGRQLRRYFEGLALVRADRNSEALALFDDLMAWPGLDGRVEGRILNSRAYVYSQLGQVEAAVTDLQQALTLWRGLADSLNEGKTLLNLGIMAYELQQYAAAESRLRAAEAAFHTAGSAQMVASVQNELGLLCRDQGRWNEALHYLNSSARQARLEGATEALATGLLNIGEVLLFQGQLAEAETTLHEALSIMPTRAYQVDIYLGLGLLRQACDDPQAAQTEYQQALACALAIDRRDILAGVHFRLGEALRLQGKDGAALEHFILAAQTVETARAPIREEGLKISLLGRWQQIYETLVLHCLHLDKPDLAWHWAERARARAFGELLNRDRVAGPPAGVIDEDATLEQVQAALPAGALLLNYFTTGVFDHHTPFWRALEKANPLRTHLLTPAQTLLFVITADQLVVERCAVDPNAFSSASRRTEDGNRFLAPKTLAQLRKMLLPFELPPQTSRLYIVPHGPLHLVPFAALTGASGQPLLQHGGPALVYAPSATILRERQQRKSSRRPIRQSCLAVGYDGGSDSRLLRHTEDEAQWVAQLTGGKAWIGPTAKKERLRQAARRVRWLHFACHGRFDYETPLASYLTIGPDERLSAEEVLQDWRLEAELVVLSACQTGVNRLLRSDEPMGLIRGFLAAGARNVLATQWPVEDLPTFLLMRHFYQQLMAEPPADPATALRAAQVWLRELTAADVAHLPVHTDNVGTNAGMLGQFPFANPRYWAGFVLFGC